MILIADSGSTKCTWCCIDDERQRHFFETEGYNPCHVNTDYIISSMKQTMPSWIDRKTVREVHFYGAGCYEENTPVTQNAFQALFPAAPVYIGSDLLAAAKALHGDKPGFAAILGTGTNTGIYDGRSIVTQIDSLGYILGDEGSGCAIGKKLLSAYVRGYLPAAIRDLFIETYGLSEFDIIDRIYSQPLANRFCAQFSRFVFDNRHIGYLEELALESFRDFFRNLVIYYPDYESYSFNCVGSVAYAFREMLEKVAQEFGMETGSILQSPIDRLVEYHMEKAVMIKK